MTPARWVLLSSLITLAACPGPEPVTGADAAEPARDAAVALDAAAIPADAAAPGPDAATFADASAGADASTTTGPDASGPADAGPADAARADAALAPDAAAAGLDAGRPDAGPTYTCADLPTLTDTATQVAVVVRDGQSSCTDRFAALLVPQPAVYVQAFMQLVGTGSVSSKLFYSVYSKIPDMKWDKAINDALYSGLQARVDSLTDASVRNNWNTYFVAVLNRGDLYLCPSPLPTTAPLLIGELFYAGYYCAEDVAQALAPRVVKADLDTLLANAQNAPRGWTRRNHWRTIGRLAEKPAGQNPRDLLDANVAAIRAAAKWSLSHDRDANALADVCWVVDAGFFPSWDVLAELEAVSLDTGFPDWLRFRAAAAVSRLMSARTGTFPSADVDYLLAALTSDDKWVRAEAAYTCEQISGKAGLTLSAADEARLTAALDAAWTAETALVAQVYLAKAIDKRTGSTKYAALKASYEATHLPTAASGTGFDIRSGLSSTQVAALVTLLDRETNAFYDQLGSAYTAPVAADPNPTATVVVFATKEEYEDYMGAFVGYGSGAGGLYVEGTGTLYTFERTPAQSTYTLQELLQHEYAHRLVARHVFPGKWGDAGYFTEARAWLDEGTAEYFAGIDFSTATYDADTLRKGPLDRLCAASFRALDGLLQQRAGYDQPGTFDYDNGWAFTYFMMHPRKATQLKLYDAWRAGTYHYAQWDAIAGVSVSALQAEWWAALTGYCAQPRWFHPPPPPIEPRDRALRLGGDEADLGRPGLWPAEAP